MAVSQVLEGRFGYADGSRGTLPGDRWMIAEMTLEAGRVVWDFNVRTGRDYRETPANYGVRDVSGIILPPRK